MDVTLTSSSSPFQANPDNYEYKAILGQLRQITKRLALVERRESEENCAPVDFSRIVRDGCAKATLTPSADTLIVQIPESVLVEGPGDDLVELIGCLIEYGYTGGPEPVRLSAQINYPENEVRPTCTTEMLLPTSEVPEFLRRKVWDTVRARRGEVTIAAAPRGSRISFTFPVERRLGTILG
jgi:hypothetical protein